QITAPDGGELHLEVTPLLTKLGLRRQDAIYTHRYYNPFRLVEDRRRIQSYWQTGGYYDAEVDEPEVDIDEQKGVKVRWVVREGPRYELASVDLLHAPEGTREALLSLVPHRPGQRYDLESMRIARYAMAAKLQRAGYGHARVYSRAYVDREKKVFHWVYLADPGPRTRVGTIRVEGARRVSEADVRRRSGLTEGGPFDLDRKEQAEFHLLDTGSFAAAVVQTSADVEQYIGDVPDSGGILTEDQVDAEGNLIPRKLPETIDLVIRLWEAPATQLKLRASAEADPTRLDALVGGELWRRDLGGGHHHLVLEGRLGYGHLWRDEPGLPSGVYGEGLLRSNHPGLLARLVDGRLSVRYRDVLYPGFHLRELTAGPGLRTTAAPGLFLDLDAYFRRGQAVDMGPFDDGTRAAYKLPSEDVAQGLEVNGSILWDRRNDPAEPTEGHFLALRTAFSPGGSVATHRYWLLVPEARGFLPLSSSLSLGARLSGGWVTLAGNDGVPQGPRLFGGGSYGIRGFGRDRLSPRARACSPEGGCRDLYVGGLSLTEGSLELRYLPYLKQTGLVFFVDAGGVGLGANPLEDGVSVAVGFGPRLRLWYLPISIDYAYRFLERGSRGSETGSFLLFLRIGEAF
ncbi:MAG: BamA/TamA family outer membrane protein, partial [Myxococcales bacterium]|nr:BamA/TamA family outer membrane protein [Polyangiaceae bacterium]MDW8251285.1 BamA/TamA family outer membrane protein [Myxococcales bacterium]